MNINQEELKKLIRLHFKNFEINPQTGSLIYPKSFIKKFRNKDLKKKELKNNIENLYNEIIEENEIKKINQKNKQQKNKKQNKNNNQNKIFGNTYTTQDLEKQEELFLRKKLETTTELTLQNNDLLDNWDD